MLYEGPKPHQPPPDLTSYTTDSFIEQHLQGKPSGDRACARSHETEEKLEPSWRVLDPNDPLSQTFVHINKLHLEAARLACPDVDDLVLDHTTRIHARTGLTNYRAEQLSLVGLTLRDFPGVAALLEEGAFCFQLVHRVCEHLSLVRPDRRQIIAAATVTLLQPSRRDQMMRTLKWVDEKVTKLIDELEPMSRPIPDDDHDEDAPDPADDYEQGVGSFHVDDRGEKQTTFVFTVDKFEGMEIMRAIRNAAKVHGITHGAALVELIRGNIEAEVTLHLFQNTGGLPLNEVFGEGHWLNTAASKHWLTRITHLAGGRGGVERKLSPHRTSKSQRDWARPTLPVPRLRGARTQMPNRPCETLRPRKSSERRTDGYFEPAPVVCQTPPVENSRKLGRHYPRGCNRNMDQSWRWPRGSNHPRWPPGQAVI